MRTLATDTYTADQVEAQLRSGSCAYRDRYELLDTAGNVVGDLDGHVTAARIEVNIDRAIKGALALDLEAHDDLADAFFRYRVRPWFGVVMPDGGVAEYPQGVFMWNSPDRDLGGIGVETWSVTLGDLNHVLDADGPDLRAFKVGGGDSITGAIARVLERAGFDDTSGVVPSDEITNELLSWSMRRNVRFRTSRGGRGRLKWHVDTNTTPETWLTVIGDLVDGIGYTGVWFDGDGRPRCGPADDLGGAAPGVTYATDVESIILPKIPSRHDLDQLGNRVFARTKSKRGDWMEAGVADLNDLAPGHPLSEAVIGRYINVPIDNVSAGSTSGLRAHARRELWRRVTTFQTVDLPTLAWPAHEAYDMVRLDYTGDREFDGGVLCHEAGWSMTLRGNGVGTMNHNLRRVVGIA